eukprot:gnl/MRDRNA2_/MRDRNA2_104545_c0_seq1.p1 gnl/MRDRNA2_/MRDRNA2_104545_c0~~gnl/MRDRNA2_/MRDRNA2_104545_c0_seq1.p1  ORF type:complete len:374 (-),score=59.02 gnl/MRDRNA2_/MRDRNA2_104545_c0_seq1:226-1347(-)
MGSGIATPRNQWPKAQEQVDSEIAAQPQPQTEVTTPPVSDVSVLDFVGRRVSEVEFVVSDHAQEEYREIDPKELTYHDSLGGGCSAQVFVGEWRGAKVAIKRLKGSKSKQKMKEKQWKEFDREMAVMQRTSHVNLVKLLGFCTQEVPCKIIMELCLGGSCFDLLHNSDHIELTWDQRLKMSSDVASGMNYLHGFDPQIIHRDLKSLNLLLSNVICTSADEPVVKVSDFGLSRMKLLSKWTKHKKTPVMTKGAGTPNWMAPECYLGNCYNEKVDVYSYAMVLFEIICREIPFEEEEPQRVCLLTVQGERPDMEAVPPDCPDLLEKLMVECWAQEPTQRPSFEVITRTLQIVKSTRNAPLPDPVIVQPVVDHEAN